MYFTPDTLGAPDVMSTPADAVSSEVRAYLDDTLRQRAIVIPKKDQHHYSAAFKKVVNLRNARRLTEKLWDQFALGKHRGVRAQSAPRPGPCRDGAQRDAAAHAL